MKNRIIKSLNLIVPTQSQKKSIYENIFRPKRKIGGYIFKACILGGFIIFLSSKPTTITQPRSLQNSSFIYNDICYEISDGYYEIGERIDSINLNEHKYDIYLNKNDPKSLVLNLNEFYELYVKCERK